MLDCLKQYSTKCAPQYNLNSSVTMETHWVPDLPILKPFLSAFSVPFYLCKQHFKCMIQQAQKDISSSLWPCLTFFRLKITNILKTRWLGNEKRELASERIFIFYSRRRVSYRTISLLSFNGLRCKLAKIGLFIYSI